MSESVHVVVDGVPVPALLLKWNASATKALVTLEIDGRVDTRWLPAEMLERTPVA
ncbi:hypothetical protein [Nocardioides albidus]|uniref:hypothetical protein n=1 Tax=Nocardioides albidus TaxID=1517589 RepID=UPI0013054505|nr:hypothetical protein [Nocardioides albidus]